MVRCVYLTNGASLSGFTLTGGGTYDHVGALPPGAKSGGGVFCEAASATVSNCVLTGNRGLDCGGAYGGTLNNCNLFNCIVYFNTATRQGPNYYLNSPSDTLDYCCTTPLPTSGSGNITAPPFFVDQAGGNLRLRAGPCINGGNNAFVAGSTYLDGRPRIVGGTVDIGAYESQTGVSGAFIGWLQQYSLPTDGSADFADTDADGMNNWQEWVCGTDPKNRLSALRLLSAAPAGSNVTVSWQSVAGVSYFLERSANLAAPFTLLATNILGQAGTTSYTDTNATAPGPCFYRVGVKCP
jgi:hypothetical protein